MWLRSCPGLLRSKTREVELLRAGGDESALHSPEYRRALAEKQRIDIIYDAVIALKELESERPIRPADVLMKYEAATALADAALERIRDLKKGKAVVAAYEADQALLDRVREEHKAVQAEMKPVTANVDELKAAALEKAGVLVARCKAAQPEL